MSEYLFFEELDLLLDGLVNAPKIIVNHLLSQEEATLEELEALVDERSKRFVDEWLRRMMSHLVLERLWDPEPDEYTYQLTPFAKDMIEHIKNFKLVTKGREE